jgi:hypothetical protein
MQFSSEHMAMHYLVPGRRARLGVGSVGVNNPSSQSTFDLSEISVYSLHILSFVLYHN